MHCKHETLLLAKIIDDEPGVKEENNLDLPAIRVEASECVIQEDDNLTK